MANKDFYYTQSDLTASKFLIYREYLSDYLPKVLTQFGKCFIADFFAVQEKTGPVTAVPWPCQKVQKDNLLLWLNSNSGAIKAVLTNITT